MSAAPVRPVHGSADRRSADRGGLVGAVLAGGRSSRLGRDKAAESVGGRRMIDRVVEAMRPLCEEIFVVSSRPDTPRGAWAAIPDLRPGQGPLAGIETALVRARAEEAEAVLVCACDLALVDGDTLAAVRDGLGDARAAAAARDGDPPFEPLLAVYRTDCFSEATRLLDGGERSARALFEAVGGRTVPVGPGKAWNVNTEADLARARRSEAM